MNQLTSRILISFGAAMLLLGATQCSNSEDTSLYPDYIPVLESKDENWGMMGPDGKMLFADEFSNCPSPVFEGVFSVKEGKDGMYTLYKADKKPRPIAECENLMDVGIMSEGLIPIVKKNERIKLVDSNGKEKFELGPIHGHEIEFCDGAFSEGLLMVITDEEKRGYVDASGKTVIKPQYTRASEFLDSRALVATGTEDSLRYSVINRKGEVDFKLRADIENVTFYGKYVSYKMGERQHILNMKGEEVLKCPAKVDNIVEIKEKYIVYYNDEHKVGVITLEGEDVIRPKYLYITLVSNGDFLCVKEDDRGIALINNKGEETKTLDVKYAMAYGPFGILAGDDNDISLYDNDLKRKGNESFYDIAISRDTSLVRSDYFDSVGTAAKMWEIFNRVFANVKLGDNPKSIKAVVAKGEQNQKYTSHWSEEGTEGKIEYYAEIQFSENIVYNDYGWDGYTWYDNYYFNPAAQVEIYGAKFLLEYDKRSHSTEAALALAKDFKNRLGLTDVKANKAGALMKKGDNLYLVYSSEESILVIVCKNNNRNLAGMEQTLVDADEADQSVVEEVVAVEEADSAIVEEVAVAEEVPAE